MFETAEVWFKLMIDLHKEEKIVAEGLSLFSWIRNDEDKRSQLAIALTLQALIIKFQDEVFIRKLSAILAKYKVDTERFLQWYMKPELNEFLQMQESGKFRDAINKVRDNKTIHFWLNRGTMKFSTIHSFKGWEANTLFLLLEPRYNSGDFQLSFDELIYTGLTRCKLNLIVLNYGNNVDHENLKRIFSFDDNNLETV